MTRTPKLPLFLVVLACGAIAVVAQESPTPDPTRVAERSARIRFLPPPIEASLSLGIYDASGKLVRVLHREADVDEFEIGNDWLSTTWDGKNNAGETMPAGKYHARGYAVGGVNVEGVGYFFNDWVTADDSARVTKITGIATEGDGFAVTGSLSSGASVTLVCDPNGDIKRTSSDAINKRPCEAAAGLPGVVDPVDCAAGKDQTLWVIDRTAAGAKATEVKQLSSGGELLRRLAISGDDPQPRQIAASSTAERIFLLEENDTMQRVRGLSLVATQGEAGQAVSDWKVEFERKIIAHPQFRIADGKPDISGGVNDEVEKVKIRLVRNPLQEDKTSDVELIAGFDADGAMLKTADGLPLQTVSETTGLRRVALVRSGDKSVDLFQDDGAVVEQFRVSNLDQMMSFDCGDFELK